MKFLTLTLLLAVMAVVVGCGEEEPNQVVNGISIFPPPDTLTWIAQGNSYNLKMDTTRLVWPVARVVGVLIGADTTWDDWRNDYFTVKHTYKTLTKDIDTICYERKECGE